MQGGTQHHSSIREDPQRRKKVVEKNNLDWIDICFVDSAQKYNIEYQGLIKKTQKSTPGPSSHSHQRCTRHASVVCRQLLVFCADNSLYFSVLEKRQSLLPTHFGLLKQGLLFGWDGVENCFGLWTFRSGTTFAIADCLSEHFLKNPKVWCGSEEGVWSHRRDVVAGRQAEVWGRADEMAAAQSLETPESRKKTCVKGMCVASSKNVKMYVWGEKQVLRRFRRLRSPLKWTQETAIETVTDAPETVLLVKFLPKVQLVIRELLMQANFGQKMGETKIRRSVK